MENPHSHIVKKFDKNLDKIHTIIEEMGGIVAKQITDSTDALLNGNTEHLDEIIRTDLQVNGLNKDIYSRAELLIARRQPVALDLRQTLAPINIALELERIGDHAKSTAKFTPLVLANPPAENLMQIIAEMSKIVSAMLADALVAYDTTDIELAETIRERDKHVDDLHRQFIQSVIEALQQTPEKAESLVHLTLMSRNFERMGDHADNIARYVHQIITGEDQKQSE